MQKLAFNVEHVKDCQFHVLQTRSERPIDTEFLNFRYFLNVTIFQFLSTNTPPLKKAIPQFLGTLFPQKPHFERTPTDSEYDVG